MTSSPGPSWKGKTSPAVGTTEYSGVVTVVPTSSRSSTPSTETGTVPEFEKPTVTGIVGAATAENCSTASLTASPSGRGGRSTWNCGNTVTAS